MARYLTENDMYAVMRYALIAQFASDDFMSSYDLDISHYKKVYDFLKDLYYEHCKNKFRKDK